MFLFRFSGWFLFRFAERRFLGGLLNAPPRNTHSKASGLSGLTFSSYRAECFQPTTELAADGIGPAEPVQKLSIGQVAGGGGQPELGAECQ